MADIERINAQQAHAKIKANQALLVCAYEDEAKCQRFHLEGSISFTSFKSRVQSLPKSQGIIFYWGWPGEASAAGQAAKYRKQGFKNVTVLKGGVEAWKAAGYAMNWIGRTKTTSMVEPRVEAIRDDRSQDAVSQKLPVRSD